MLFRSQILLKMVECAVLWDVNGYELGRQSFRDAVDRYWRDSDRAEDCWFPQKPALDLRKAVSGVLHGAIGETECYGKDAGELKKMLYNTTNLATISPEDFEELALRHITLDGINLIFKQVPESRLFINFLSAIGRNGHSDNENSYR